MQESEFNTNNSKAAPEEAKTAKKSKTASIASKTIESSSKTENSAPKKTISEKIDQLENEVNWFYGDDFSLEESAARYKSALALARSIESDLDSLKNEITTISEDFSKGE